VASSHVRTVAGVRRAPLGVQWPLCADMLGNDGAIMMTNSVIPHKALAQLRFCMQSLSDSCNSDVCNSSSELAARWHKCATACPSVTLPTCKSGSEL
jgi:hypothetical protein